MVDVDIIFLAGGPRRSPVEYRTGWPLFRLPVNQDRCLLAAWKVAIQGAFSKASGMRAQSWRVLLSKGRDSDVGIGVPGAQAVYETKSHRGTAGAMFDDARRAGGTAPLVLVVELSACPAVHLKGLLAASEQISGIPRACVIGESSLRRYCGVALCNRSMFDLVPEVGFFDFKEQLLPAVRNAGGAIEAVRVADRARRVRTRAEWLDAVQAWREFAARSEVVGDCGADWAEGEGNRSVISRRAFADGATVVSSIVMDEAVVEPGALVARSIIGPGMRVPAGTRVIDAILADPAAGEAAIRRSGTGGTVAVASE